MRLDKFICKSTELSRTDAKKMLHKGLVKVNGEVKQNPAMQVHEDNSVTLDGKELAARTSRYIMLHKPLDTICSNIDESYPSLFHLVKVDKAFDMHVAGRLDADTTGLVLITDDGRWSHNIIMPKKQCEKVYLVGLRSPIADDVAEQFAEGILLRGESTITRPAKLTIIEPDKVLLTITEGRYHQVKRMFAAVGNRVVSLHRQKVGSVELDIELGAWRYLTEDEVNSFL